MPTYQYSCTECHHYFEVVQSFSDDSLTVCPECEGRLRKVFNAVGVVFKGSGFYRTDSRSAPSAGDAPGSGNASKSGSSSDAGSSSSGSSSSDSSSSDSGSGTSTSSSGTSSSKSTSGAGAG